MQLYVGACWEAAGVRSKMLQDGLDEVVFEHVHMLEEGIALTETGCYQSPKCVYCDRVDWIRSKLWIVSVFAS